MLEYTSAGHLPQIIRDNSGPGLKPADLLPALRPNPLNSSQPTNLAGSQKLLSVGGDIDFPVIPGHFGDWSDGIEIDWLGSSDPSASESSLSLSMVYIFCTVCILCYIVYRLCHNQYNCRLRRRQNTLARLISAV